MVRQAMDSWENATSITFLEGCDTNVDSEISFETFAHGDEAPFDGVNGVLAHAAGPSDNGDGEGIFGDLHFDDSELFTAQFQNGMNQPINFQTVALHELGHVLGLDHSGNGTAVMAPTYQGNRTILTTDDKQGVRAMYGNFSSPIGGPSHLYTNSSFRTRNYFLDVCLPTGFTVQWLVDYPLTILSGQGTTNLTIRYPSNTQDRSVNVKCIIRNNCGGSRQFVRNVRLIDTSQPGNGTCQNCPVPLTKNSNILLQIDRTTLMQGEEISIEIDHKVTDTPFHTDLNLTSGIISNLGKVHHETTIKSTGPHIVPTKGLPSGIYYISVIAMVRCDFGHFRVIQI